MIISRHEEPILPFPPVFQWVGSRFILVEVIPDLSGIIPQPQGAGGEKYQGREDYNRVHAEDSWASAQKSQYSNTVGTTNESQRDILKTKPQLISERV